MSSPLSLRKLLPVLLLVWGFPDTPLDPTAAGVYVPGVVVKVGCYNVPEGQVRLLDIWSCLAYCALQQQLQESAIASSSQHLTQLACRFACRRVRIIGRMRLAVSAIYRRQLVFINRSATNANSA